MGTLNRIAMWVLAITLIAGGIMWYSFDASEFDPRNFDSFEDAVESTIEGSFEGSGKLDYDYYAEKNVMVPEKKISVATVSSDVTVKYHSDDSIKVIFHGKTSTDDDGKLPKLIVKDSDHTVDIEVKWPNMNIGFLSTDLSLEVYMPESYGGQLAFDTVSGDVYLSNGTFEDVTIETVSGDFESNSISVDDFRINTTSGDAECSGLEAERIIIETTSGDMELDDVSGDIEFGSVSGSMDFSLSKWTGNIHGSSVSGEVSIFAPNEALDVNMKSVSGDVDSNFKFDDVAKKDDDVLNADSQNNDYRVDVDTVSGDIELNQ